MGEIFLENPSSQPNKTKIPTLLPNLLLATQVYSRPSALVTSLSKGFRKEWQKSFAPYSKAGHQACGGVGFDNGKPFCVAVNLSAPLKYRAIGFFFIQSIIIDPHLAPDDGDGLVSKGVADQGRVLLHYRCPIVGSNLRCGNVKRENAAESNLEVDGNLDVKENGFAHLTHSVLNLTPGEIFDNQSVGDCANSSGNT